MSSPQIITFIHNVLNHKLNEIENHFKSDMIYINGPISDDLLGVFLECVEELIEDKNEKHDGRLLIMLTTTGGSAEVVERLVNICRAKYNEVNFLVPDYAYSAGTIFCMSGDSIYMDYSSVLGPIDPQVMNKDGKYVAALGYLDKMREFVEKSQIQQLSEAEFLMLKEMDLAELRSFEQAVELTTDLLKDWLVRYKFKNWDKHSDNTDVTEEDKVGRAVEIAQKLADYKEWKTHGRPLNIETLTNLKLKIEDYSNDNNLRPLIRDYYNYAQQYMGLIGYGGFIHTRRHI